MEILGIGPSELVFIVVIALIVLGPRDMQKAGRTIGTWLRRVVTSDGWKLFQQTSREIQTLPNRLMREAALDELKNAQQDLSKTLEVDQNPAEQRPSPMAARTDIDQARIQPEPRVLPDPPTPAPRAQDHDPHA